MNRWSVGAAAREAPDALALISAEGRWTYRDLVAPVRAAAAGLAAAGVDLEGVRPGRVMMVAPNSVDTIFALLALFEAGVPVMLVHPRSTAQERDVLARSYPPAVRLDTVPSPCEGVSVEADADVPASRDMAVFFTSGTTGRPKAVRLSRRAFEAAAQASAANLGWRSSDRWLLTIPVAHVGGLSILTRCWLARRTVVLTQTRDPDALVAECTQHRVSLISLVPTQLKRLLPRRAPPTLRAVLLGGAPSAPSLVARAQGLGWPVITTYGLTEACSQVTVQRLDRQNGGRHGVDADDRGPDGVGGDSGRPVEGTEVLIRDGHILVRGPTLLSGYVKPADGPAPGSPLDADGWFDTGDLGHLSADGRLFVHARRQDLILSGGENVYPKEVEAALSDLPGVEDAVVFGVEDQEWGQAVAALIVPSGPDLVLAAVQAAARQRLAGPKRPRWWAVTNRLPLTASGKIDRRKAIDHAKIRLEKSPPSP